MHQVAITQPDARCSCKMAGIAGGKDAPKNSRELVVKMNHHRSIYLSNAIFNTGDALATAKAELDIFNLLNNPIYSKSKNSNRQRAALALNLRLMAVIPHFDHAEPILRHVGG